MNPFSAHGFFLILILGFFGFYGLALVLGCGGNYECISDKLHEINRSKP